MNKREAIRLGLLIRAAREQRGKTQRQFARQLGVGQQTLSEWERGIGLGKIIVAWRLAEILADKAPR